MVVAENVFYVMGAPVSQQNSTQKCINAVFLLGNSSEKKMLLNVGLSHLSVNVTTLCINIYQ